MTKKLFGKGNSGRRRRDEEETKKKKKKTTQEEGRPLGPVERAWVQGKATRPNILNISFRKLNRRNF